MLALFDPRVWLVFICLMGAAYGGGRWHQYKSDAKNVAAVELKATQEARAKEAAWAETTSRIRDAKDREIEGVNAQLVDALDRLRDRSERRLPVAAACSSDGSGATGAHLSRPDGEFLARLAASADKTAADLRACQAWVKAVTK